MPTAIRTLLFIAIGTVVFSNSFGNPMLLDDFETITENQQIRNLASLDVLMPQRELPVAGRPLSNVTFALNYALSGEAVRSYRATNLALHILCAIVAFLLFEQLLRLPAMPASARNRASHIAFTAALVWLVHPLNSEVVNYLTERTESLMALFFLLTLYCSVRAIDSPSRGWSAGAVLTCAVGALCKESIAVAPLVVIALDRLLVFPSWRQAWQARRGLYVGLACSWLVLAGLQATRPRPFSAGFGSGLSPWTYLLNQAVMIGQYLKLTVWPHELVVLYGRPLPLSVGDVLPQGALILALLAATVVALRRWPAVGAAFLFFFLTLAPTSSILPIATEVGAERRMYLPLLAISVLFSSALWRLVRNTWASTAVAALLVIVLGTTTYARNSEYANPLTLAETTLNRWPTGMGHQLLAEELMKVGRRGEAMEHLRAAIPDTPRARFALGLELYNAGQLDEAIEQFQTFVRLEPAYFLVPNAQGLTARAYARQERWNEAVAAAQEALAKAPENPDALLVLAESQFRQSQLPEAIASYRRYLAVRPSDVAATTNLAVSLMAANRPDEGLDAFRRAADLDPNNWQMRRNLAMALLDADRPAESINEARRAVTLRPEDGRSHTILGQGLARVGQFPAATAEFERALQLDPTDADARRYLEQLRRR